VGGYTISIYFTSSKKIITRQTKKEEEIAGMGATKR